MAMREERMRRMIEMVVSFDFIKELFVSYKDSGGVI